MGNIYIETEDGLQFIGVGGPLTIQLFDDPLDADVVVEDVLDAEVLNVPLVFD